MSKKGERIQHARSVHVHVKLPSRQDAQPQVPWRHNVGGAECGAHTHGPTHAAHKHSHDQTEEGSGGVKVVKEKAQGGPAHYLLTFTDLARANVLRVGRCAYAPVPHRIWLSPGPPCGETRHGNERAVSSNSAVAPVVASVVLTFTQMSSHVGLFTRPAGQIPSSIGKVLNCLRAQLSIIMGYVTRTR